MGNIERIIFEEIETALDFNRNMSYIPQGYEHNILDEAYESIQQLKKITLDAIELIAKTNNEIYGRDGIFKTIYGINLTDLSDKEYGELNDFVRNNNLVITFIPKNGTNISGTYISDEYGSKNDYNTNDEKSIEMGYNEDSFKKTVDSLINDENPIPNWRILSLFYNEFSSTLIHELQHAYDDYRSKGEIYKTKKFNNFRKKYESNASTKNVYNDLNKVKSYLNLPHEIWARYTQAINKSQFYSWDITDDGLEVLTMKPMYAVIKLVTLNFMGFNQLSDNIKNRIIRKTAQFWHYEKDKIDMKNAEEVKKHSGKINENIDDDILKLKKLGYSIIDKQTVGNYTIMLLSLNNNFYEISLTSNGEEFTTSSSQIKKPTMNKSSDILNTYNQFNKIINGWVRKYSPIYVGSFNKERTTKYHNLLKNMGIDVDEIRHDDSNGEFPESWNFKVLAQ